MENIWILNENKERDRDRLKIEVQDGVNGLYKKKKVLVISGELFRVEEDYYLLPFICRYMITGIRSYSRYYETGHWKGIQIRE